MLRPPGGISRPDLLIVIGGRDNQQNAADRLDPVRISVRGNKTHHYFDRRSSSAITKYADALRRMSFAWSSSRFSCFIAFILSASSVGTLACLPLSTSAFLTQSFSLCAQQPIFAAIDTMAYKRDWCWPSLSSTGRTARSRTSGENLFVVSLMIIHSTQELDPQANPAQ